MCGNRLKHWFGKIKIHCTEKKKPILTSPKFKPISYSSSILRSKSCYWLKITVNQKNVQGNVFLFFTCVKINEKYNANFFRYLEAELAKYSEVVALKAK